METVNLVNTITRATQPKGSNVAVSNDPAIAEAGIKPSAGGQVLPEQSKENQQKMSERIEETVSELNSFVQNIQRGIQFSVHEDTGRSIVTVTDSETGDVIRSFPSEQVLAVASYLAENKAQAEDAARGLLVNESA